MSGLSNILDLIEVRANERIEEIIKDAEVQKEQIIGRAREKAEKTVSKKVKEVKLELESSPSTLTLWVINQPHTPPAPSSQLPK